MGWILLFVVIAIAIVVAMVARRRAGADTAPVSQRPAARRPAVTGPFLGPVATVHLDVVVRDPGAPSGRRLAERTAAHVLRTSPDVEEVRVEDRDGRLVASIPRQTATPGPPPTRPEAAARPSRPHGSWTPPPVVPGVEQDIDVERRPLAERLDLPEQVRARLRDPDDAVDLVRAMLEAAGRPAEVEGRMVRSDGDVVIVVDDTAAGASAALSQAFLRFRRSGATRGVAIHLGYVDPREVARRRALAPDLHHAGLEVLQEMADAVDLGGDPVQFALADLVG